MIFVAKKNGMTKNFSPSSFGAVVRSEIRIPRWIKIRNRDPEHHKATRDLRLKKVTKRGQRG
jgi:hypothetical protein